MKSAYLATGSIVLSASLLLGGAPPEAEPSNASKPPSVTFEDAEFSVPTEPTLTTMTPAEQAAQWKRLRAGQKGPPANDFERLLGAWIVETCTMNGEPVAETIGQVEIYDRQGQVHIYGSDFEAWQHFVVDVSAEPRRLSTSYTEGFVDGPGIYAFDGDEKLKVRESLTPQTLSFEKRPQGDWWDTTLRKLSPEQTKSAIAAIEARWRDAEEDEEGEEKDSP